MENNEEKKKTKVISIRHFLFGLDFGLIFVFFGRGILAGKVQSKIKAALKELLNY